MFDPLVGRFLEEDPEGFEAGDPHLFRYVGNNPTNATDPSGAKVYEKQQDLPKDRVFMDQRFAPTAKVLEIVNGRSKPVEMSSDEYFKALVEWRKNRLAGIKPQYLDSGKPGYFGSSASTALVHADTIKQPFYQLLEYLQRRATAKTSSVTVQVRYIDTEKGRKSTAPQFAQWVLDNAEPDSVNLYYGHGVGDNPLFVDEFEKSAVLEALEKVPKKPSLVNNPPTVSFLSCYAGEFNLNMPEKLRIQGAMETKYEVNVNDYSKAGAPLSLHLLKRIRSTEAKQQKLIVNLFFGEWGPEYVTKRVDGRVVEQRDDTIDNPHFLDWNFRMSLRHARYYTESTNNWGKLVADARQVGERESLELIPVEGKKVAILYGTGYVTAAQGGGGEVEAQAFILGPWEKWTRVDNDDRTVSFQSANGKNYLSAVGGGGGGLTAQPDKPRDWEKFTLVNQNGLVALKAKEGQFITAQH